MKKTPGCGFHEGVYETASPSPYWNQPTINRLEQQSQADGNLVLDSQAHGKLVFINIPGTPQETASVLLLTLYNDKDGPVTPVDDTRFVPKAGPQGTAIMLFSDANNAA